MVKPFSFIFFLNADNNRYIIWETLNTKEATYTWMASKTSSFKHFFIQIENDIKQIKQHKKSNYLSQKKENFYRIYHDYSNINGFKKWKMDIEYLIN